MNASRNLFGTTVFLTSLFFLWALAAVPQSQTPTPSLSYEGQPISSVELAGRPDLELRQLKPLIAQPAHAPYSQQKVNETIEALKKNGKFQDVTYQVSPEADGLRVLFVLQPAYYFGVYSFPNAVKQFSYPRLLQVSDYPNQEPYTSAKVEEAESNLLDFFHQTGFFLATVEPKLQTDSKHGLVNVTFDVNLRHRAHFGEIKITGSSPEQTRRLQRSLRSLRARLRGAYLKPGKTYSRKRLQTAITFMQSQLGKQHYLAAKVKLVSALYHPETNRADITFNVEQGERIAIRIVGAHVWGRTQKRIIPMYQENAVDPDLVHEGEQNLTSLFQQKGFFDVKVQSQIINENSGTTIIYHIERGPRGKVDSVNFHGNQHFSDGDLKSYAVVNKHKWYNPFSRGAYSQQLVRRSVKNIEDAYRAAGYSQVKVTPHVSNRSNRIEITFDVEEGQRDIVDSLDIQGNKSISHEQLAPKGLNLEPGKAYSSVLLQKDRNHILATYLDRGFLTASFRSTVRPLKDDPHHIQVIYEINEGPQVKTTSLIPIGNNHTRPEIVASTANIKAGEPLSKTAELKGESKLYSLGIFDWTSIDTRRPITDQPDAEVLVKMHEAKRNSITYGFGFQVINRGGNVPSGTVALPGLPPVGLPSQFQSSQKTFWGPQGSIEYTRRNFRGRAETLTFTAFAGRLTQRGSGAWLDPTFWNTSWTTTLNANIERSSENPIFTYRLAEAGYQFQKFLDRNKQKSVVFRYNFRRTNLTNILIPGLVLPEDQNVRLSTLSASFSRDSRDNALDAHKGIYESFEFDLNPSVLGSNTNFVRFLGQTAYYRTIGNDKVVWANSIRLGLEQAFAGAHIPISETFFSGGGSTLRGFTLNGAGPQRQVEVCNNGVSGCNQFISVPVGGPQLVIFNTEVRFPSSIISHLGGVVFYDGGNVYSSIGLHNFFSNFSNTVGAGARYATPIGPIRFDVGHLINAPPGLKSVQYFITLGQAF